MKKIASLFLLLAFDFCVFSQNVINESGEKLYQKALTSFENADYGSSLKYCEDAILARKQQILSEKDYLTNSLQPRQVQKAGSKIEEINKVLLEREDYEALRIITYYQKKKGFTYFEDNINLLLDYLDTIQYYPEALKLLGDIYKIEGEYEFSEQYYKNALKYSTVLDIPDTRYEILYLLADLSRLKGNENEMETRLLSILTEDKNYLNKPLVNGLTSQIKKNQKDSLEKFFSMYRANSYYMMDAYSQLADYYFEKGEKEKTLVFSSLHAITSYTKIIHYLEKRNSEFKNNGFSSVLQELSLYDDLVQWGNNHDIWNGYVKLAEYSKNYGYIDFSDSLLKAIAENCPEKNSQKRAVILLSNK